MHPACQPGSRASSTRSWVGHPGWIPVPPAAESAASVVLADGPVRLAGQGVGPFLLCELAAPDSAGVLLPGVRSDVPADGSPGEGGCEQARAIRRQVGGEVAVGLDWQRWS